MIVHVVTFRMSAPELKSRVRAAEQFGARLGALAGKIPGLTGIEIDLGRLHGHADMVLTSRHRSYAGLEAYQAHPLHVEVAQFGRTVVAERTTVDYEVDGDN
ncbi:stress responsive alpha/beta barrel protein [Cryobacterium psychrophilum]|nr:stress responsive alpha/beta barrel protein [Cryobacterium psychrophilum]